MIFNLTLLSYGRNVVRSKERFSLHFTSAPTTFWYPSSWNRKRFVLYELQQIVPVAREWPEGDQYNFPRFYVRKRKVKVINTAQVTFTLYSKNHGSCGRFELEVICLRQLNNLKITIFWDNIITLSFFFRTAETIVEWRLPPTVERKTDSDFYWRKTSPTPVLCVPVALSTISMIPNDSFKHFFHNYTVLLNCTGYTVIL